ncbi:hypothetical protein ACIBAC_00515 [Streptomyces sp. NPDC051362]|uniref:hypothetical protein n=1 Tax=Streptomyces sp. NPDC051362 TaxID=3365651 RepID=UPI0037AE67B8
MSDPIPPLRQTLARIADLRVACGRDPDTCPDVAQLSYDTGVSEEDVRILLEDGEPVPVDPDTRVRDRVRFLYETRTEAGEPHDIHTLAAAIEATPTWTRKLVAGDAKPSIVAGHQLARHYGVAATFLTDSPVDAVNRELQAVVFDLEVEADPERKLKDLGVAHIAGRTAGWDRAGLAEVVKMVADIQAGLNKVTGIVAAQMTAEETP